MIIEVYQTGDGTEQAVRFVSDMGETFNSYVVNGEFLLLQEARQVNFDGDEPELEEILLGKVFTRTRTEEENDA